MIPYLGKNSSIEEMYQVAESDGVFIIQDYLTGDELKALT